MNTCDNCGKECEEIYVDLKNGEYLCSECYFSDDDDDNYSDIDDTLSFGF